MKCSTCGADYPARDLKCPYCGNPNKLGEIWQDEEKKAKEKRDITKKNVIKSMPLYVANRITTIILGLAIVIFVVALIVMAVSFKVEEISVSRKQASASISEAEALYRAADYQALAEYMDDHELAGEDAYAKYYEAVLLNEKYEDFLTDWMRYDSSSVEYLESHCDYGPVEYLLEDYAEAMQKDSYYYDYGNSENEALYASIVEEMRAVMVGELKCDAQDLELMETISTYGDDWDNFVKKVYTKNGWEYNENENE